MSQKLFIILASAAIALTSAAREHSRATLAAVYKYEYSQSGLKEIVYRTDEMMLQISPEESRFFSTKTEFHDSLKAAPGGAELLKRMQMDVLNNSGAIERDADGNIKRITVTKDMMDATPRRGITENVYKYPDEGQITVIKCESMPEDVYYEYTVPMDELVWETGDSTKMILGYECQNAEADYHGRRWRVWYTPDIPVSEGPWQLAGLPGLILEAETEGGEYRFTATGIHETDEMIKDLPGNPVTEKSTRKEVLKIRKENATSVPLNGVIIVGAEGRNRPFFHDFMETDYND